MCYATISGVAYAWTRWLDVTPTSRVISRCTQDIQAGQSQRTIPEAPTTDTVTVDGRIPQEQALLRKVVPCYAYTWCADVRPVALTLSLLAKLAIVMLFAPVFILPALLTAFLCGWLGKLYLKAQLSVKREMSNLKAPVIETISSAIVGLSEPNEHGTCVRLLTAGHNLLQPPSELTAPKTRSRAR